MHTAIYAKNYLEQNVNYFNLVDILQLQSLCEFSIAQIEFDANILYLYRSPNGNIDLFKNTDMEILENIIKFNSSLLSKLHSRRNEI